jgi:hypothetical protein
VLVKSAVPSLTIGGLYSFFTEDLVDRMYRLGQLNPIATQRLLLILPLAYLFFLRQTVQRPAYRYILILLTIASFIHIAVMLYAGTPRYEAALIGCSVIICITLLIKYTNWTSNQPLSGPEWVKILLVAFIVTPLFLRGWNGFSRSSNAAISIYDQQVQMGHFVHDYYDQDAVAINDIGAVSFFSHGYNLDLWGLGDVDIARSRRKHYNTPDFLDSLSHHRQVKIAIVFERSYPELFQRWTKVASWTIPYNNASFNASVCFYAVDSTEAPRLAGNLKQFQASLPKGVEVNYYPERPNGYGIR